MARHPVVFRLGQGGASADGGGNFVAGVFEFRSMPSGCANIIGDLRTRLAFSRYYPPQPRHLGLEIGNGIPRDFANASRNRVGFAGPHDRSIPFRPQCINLGGGGDKIGADILGRLGAAHARLAAFQPHIVLAPHAFLALAFAAPRGQPDLHMVGHGASPSAAESMARYGWR
jgi:hypothetical protein